ncbi:MAG: arylesterase [Proteobacteria bacterium]|nr:arylesterase [Pseudomonadota bacterium]
MLFASASVCAQGRPVRLVAFGDSLTAGYQLPADAAFPVVLEKALRGQGLAVEISNAGVSGDTTAGGLARLDWSVPDGTDGVILELGANDALRGLDPRQTEANLDQMIASLKQRSIAVFLAGMLAPPNNGAEYGAAFNPIFARLAARHGLALYPFFLDGVTGVGGMTLADGMHPNRAGVEEIVRRILPMIAAFVRERAPTR